MKQSSQIHEEPPALHLVKFRYSGFRGFRGTWIVLAALIGASIPIMAAPQVAPQHPDRITIRGIVLDSSEAPVSDASVVLKQKDGTDDAETKTNKEGLFVFSVLRSGAYVVSAERSGLHSRDVAVSSSYEQYQKDIRLVLEPSGLVLSHSSSSSATPTEAMDFADQPNFTVAGITDWTAVGGHGSDTSLRTSEALTRETLTLKPHASEPNTASLHESASSTETEDKLQALLASAPGSFEANHSLGEFYLQSGRYRESIPLLEVSYRIDPENYRNGYDLAVAYKQAGSYSLAAEQVRKMETQKDNAELHRLQGDISEKMGDPLAAVHEYEQATRLDPSEQNYFDWGSELLLHRAVWQSQEVFARGTETHPKSARMLTGLGTALFASGLYDQAALRLCSASDLNPSDPDPYIFLGKIEIAAPMPLPCAEEKLARFVKEQPESAFANYYYAMALWKRQDLRQNPQAAQQIEALLTKAVTRDPKCADGYLQLGAFYFAQLDSQRAISFYVKAIEIDPQLGEAHYRLGVAYDRTGQSAKAKEQFRLHDEIEEQQAAVIERQRREVKQFLVVLHGPPASSSVH